MVITFAKNTCVLIRRHLSLRKINLSTCLSQMVGQLCCISTILQYHSTGTQVTCTCNSGFINRTIIFFYNPDVLPFACLFFFVLYDLKRLWPYEPSRPPCFVDNVINSPRRGAGEDNIRTTILHADKTLETNEVCFL